MATESVGVTSVAGEMPEDAALVEVAQLQRLVEMQEEKLHWYANAFESAGYAVTMVDLQGRIVGWNAEAEKLFGYSAAEMIGKDTTPAMNADMMNERTSIVSRARETGRPVYVETKRPTKDGRMIDIAMSVAPVRNAAGDVIGTTAITRDISSQRLAAEQLELRNSMLEQSNLDLKNFAHIASHDLQQPLRAVVGFAELLRDGYASVLDDKARHYVENILEGGRQMQQLVRDVLDYSMVPRSRVVAEPVDMNDLVAQVVRGMRPGMQPGAEIHVDELPVIIGDESQLAQVMRNLLSNALKFNESQRPVVRVTARRTTTTCQIRVSDQGIGLEPEQMAYVFDMFQRAHPRDEYEGSGIGLAIVRRIIERHGGDFGCESNAGPGMTFWFALKLATPDAE